MRQLDLMEWTPPLLHPRPNVAFDGETYDAAKDHKRLRGQLERVFELMRDNAWRSLSEIQSACGGSEASVSARLRDLRKPQYGDHKVERQRVTGGLWRYRLVPVMEAGE